MKTQINNLRAMLVLISDIVAIGQAVESRQITAAQAASAVDRAGRRFDEKRAGRRLDEKMVPAQPSSEGDDHELVGAR